MVWPGVIQPGRVSDALVDFSDFLPTVCELASCDPGAVGAGDGRSFAAHLLSGDSAPRDWVFSEWDSDWFVRDHRWKLYGDGRLVEMQDDGGEVEVQTFDTEASPSSRASSRLSRIAADLLDGGRAPLGRVKRPPGG